MIPRKMISGDVFRSGVVQTVNAIIDYLSETRLVQGAGVRINRTPAGTVIDALPANVSPGTSATAGSAYDGPFACTLSKDKNSVHVNSGVIYAGKNQISVDSQTIAIASGMDVCVRVEWINELFSASLVSGIPAETDTIWTRILFHCTYDSESNEYVYTQNVYGNLEINGRWLA